MDKRISDYYQKAQRIIDETDGAILTYQERNGNMVTTNTLINQPEKEKDVLQMFRSNYIACKMLLEAMEGECVKKYGAETLLMETINMPVPENLHKAVITKI